MKVRLLFWMGMLFWELQSWTTRNLPNFRHEAIHEPVNSLEYVREDFHPFSRKRQAQNIPCSIGDACVPEGCSKVPEVGDDCSRDDDCYDFSEPFNKDHLECHLPDKKCGAPGFFPIDKGCPCTELHSSLGVCRCEIDGYCGSHRGIGSACQPLANDTSLCKDSLSCINEECSLPNGPPQVSYVWDGECDVVPTNQNTFTACFHRVCIPNLEGSQKGTCANGFNKKEGDPCLIAEECETQLTCRLGGCTSRITWSFPDCLHGFRCNGNEPACNDFEFKHCPEEIQKEEACAKRAWLSKFSSTEVVAASDLADLATTHPCPKENADLSCCMIDTEHNYVLTLLDNWPADCSPGKNPVHCSRKHDKPCCKSDAPCSHELRYNCQYPDYQPNSSNTKAVKWISLFLCWCFILFPLVAQ